MVNNKLERAIERALANTTSEHTKRVYERHLKEFTKWYAGTKQREFSGRVVQKYATLLRDGEIPRADGGELSRASINQRLSVLRKLDPERPIVSVRTVQRGAVSRGETQALTRQQAQRMIRAPGTGEWKGLRERAIIALLLGCGLHRSELVNLTSGHIQKRAGRWFLLHFKSKHGKARTVPIPQWVKQAIDEYAKVAKLKNGFIFPSVDRWGHQKSDHIADQMVYDLVVEYGNLLGIEKLSPDALKKTFESLLHGAGEGLHQIVVDQDSLEATERILSQEKNLNDLPCDRLGLKL